MKARLLLLLVLGVALAAMPAVAFGDSARHLKNSTTYPDSTGEDPAAPDITSVVVSNDDAVRTFKLPLVPLDEQLRRAV